MNVIILYREIISLTLTFRKISSRLEEIIEKNGRKNFIGKSKYI